MPPNDSTLPLHLEQNVPLAPLCTLELGGPARYLLHATDEEMVVASLRWAAQAGLPVAILGGGSNLVISDQGFSGLVIRMALRGTSFKQEGEQGNPRHRVLVTAQAGEPWDELVAKSVASDLAGLECLSGIPGLCGATPIQNVGAYGQDVSETLRSVRILDQRDLVVRDLSPEECAFGYRDSTFKHPPSRHVVLSVTFALVPGGAPALRYPELLRALPPPGNIPPSLGLVRDTVIALRRRKSMVIDCENMNDENRRSVGSFFMNPVLPAALAQAAVKRAIESGAAATPAEVPQWPAADGKIKLAAGWLIERAGVRKGERLGPVGVSSRHALCLVHHGGGTTTQLLTLARRVRDAVHGRFGVTLQPEPVFWGLHDGLDSTDIFVSPRGR